MVDDPGHSELVKSFLFIPHVFPVVLSTHLRAQVTRAAIVAHPVPLSSHLHDLRRQMKAARSPAELRSSRWTHRRAVGVGKQVQPHREKGKTLMRGLSVQHEKHKR